MKSEHRHELAENELEKALNQGLDKIEPYSNQILIGVLVAAVVGVGVFVMTRNAGAKRAAGWTELSAARSAEDFAGVADQFQGTEVWGWAKLRAAQSWLQEGIQRSLNDRAASNDRLEEARQAYDEILKNSSVPAEVREQALFGMASCLETMSNGDTESAIAAYEQLVKEYPQSRFRSLAEDRIAALKTGRIQDFYAWFSKQNPKPEDRPLPQDFGALGGPDDAATNGELMLPDLGALNPAASPETSAGENPAASPEKPAGENPAEAEASDFDENDRPPTPPLPEPSTAASPAP